MTGVIRVRTGAAHTRILGVGSYRPSRVVPNSEIVGRIDSTDEWVVSRSGIRQRRWAGAEESVAEMAASAAGKAMAHAGIGPERIDAVIVATISNMRQTPAVAVDIAAKLGIGHVAAFDVSAACAGFCYAVGLASDMLRGGSATYALVIGVERLSDMTDHDDRGTAFLFGDGAGAVVVGPSETPGIGPVVWGADHDQIDAVGTPDWRDAWAHPEQGTPKLYMAGQRVFRWASYQMVPVAKKALELAGVTPAELDVFIPHQANNRITDAMIKALKLPAHVRVARDIAEMGNTSAASVPLAMDQMLASGQARSGELALLIGFGAGLVYAAQVVTLP